MIKSMLKLFALSLLFSSLGLDSISTSENMNETSNIFLNQSKILTLDIQQDSEGIDIDNKNVHHSELLLPLCTVITQPEFLAEFQPISRIGGGGEATVTHVKDKRTGTSYALVLSRETETHEEKRGRPVTSKPNRRKSFIERMLENQEVNPHQAKIYAYFWIVNPNYPFSGDIKEGVIPYENLKEGHILNDFYSNDPDAIIYRHEAFLLELGLGDLETELFRNLGFDPIVSMLMRAICCHSFCQACIYTCDDKVRNYIFLETSGQTYQGQEMNAYDFWYYQVGSLDIYLPMPSHIVKRIDFRTWSLDDDIHTPEESFLTTLSRLCGISEEELRLRFCQKPADPNARILRIKPWDERL